MKATQYGVSVACLIRFYHLSLSKTPQQIPAAFQCKEHARNIRKRMTEHNRKIDPHSYPRRCVDVASTSPWILTWVSRLTSTQALALALALTWMLDIYSDVDVKIDVTVQVGH